jgi:hypothetical protein
MVVTTRVDVTRALTGLRATWARGLLLLWPPLRMAAARSWEALVLQIGSAVDQWCISVQR